MRDLKYNMLQIQELSSQIHYLKAFLYTLNYAQIDIAC